VELIGNLLKQASITNLTNAYALLSSTVRLEKNVFVSRVMPVPGDSRFHPAIAERRDERILCRE